MSRDERDAARRQPDLLGAGGSSGSQRSGARALDEGPGARWAVLLAVVAVLPAPVVLLELLRSLPERGWEQAIVPLLLIVSWLAGAYSLARVLQLAVHALTRPAPPRRREPSFSLTQAHTLHSIWLIGLGASIAFMGLLGLWSWADGRTSGLGARLAADPDRNGACGAQRRCLPLVDADVAGLREPMTGPRCSDRRGRSGRRLRWARASAR